LNDLTAQRDALAKQIKTTLDAAEFHGVVLDHETARGLNSQVQYLLLQMSVLAATAK